MKSEINGDNCISKEWVVFYYGWNFELGVWIVVCLNIMKEYWKFL